MYRFKNKILVVLLIVFIVIITYTIWDNNRVTIVEEDILVEDLPIELEGFKILQVTDLHEKEFGYNQHKLIDKINSIEYYVLALTGDFLKSPESLNYSPTYELLDSIQNKNHVLYVPGNTDPDPYFIKNGTVSKNSFLLGLEERGVKLLESVYTINQKGANVQFVHFELSIIDPKSQLAVSNDRKTAVGAQHTKSLLLEMPPLDDGNKSAVLIALTHYPVVDARIDQIMENPNLILRKYDLITAGHYHGGQIRLPFVGALFVPEAWYDRSGLFPPQDRVKGLWQYKGTKQFVSAGLGSSNAIPLLNFRFLNTPEIAVLTLRRK
ncbi:metallophosphoesterase [Metabacillus litoralis]|uniref:Metallophosphoesterase n=1 Tax=Metabacillus litoralis TaxID=152268 RepID=A0A5C6W366_9BACI|nr:metallophosphoesterase [Metabacillus litoralis]TXC92348.1 metallophosphoesterase [Metabacillus litoralis]